MTSHPPSQTALPRTPEDHHAELLVGCHEVSPAGGLLVRLQEAAAVGRPLLIKLGCDPTAADLHLGHTVVLAKLAHFQRLGHQVVFIVGDTTAAIGDPSGRNKLRPPLAKDDIAAHAKTYTDQVARVLDLAATRVVFNSSWLAELGCEAFIGLLARYNLGRMLERRDFRDRLAAGQQISMHELAYPLLQGYDSVKLACDVELGGEDQIFNLNVGRHLMAAYGVAPQVVMTLPLLVGTDGEDKMSKSKGNFIGITEAKEAMFAKCMSISDATMASWYPLLLTTPQPEGGHPLAHKKHLAGRLVARFHGEAAAAEVAAWWEVGRPPLAALPPLSLSGPLSLQKLVQAAGGAKSGQEARRKVQQGGVSLDGERCVDPAAAIVPGSYLLRVGRQLQVAVTVAAPPPA